MAGASHVDSGRGACTDPADVRLLSSLGPSPMREVASTSDLLNDGAWSRSRLLFNDDTEDALEVLRISPTSVSPAGSSLKNGNAKPSSPRTDAVGVFAPLSPNGGVGEVGIPNACPR